jgi:hypothetical protein
MDGKVPLKLRLVEDENGFLSIARTLLFQILIRKPTKCSSLPIPQMTARLSNSSALTF